MTGLLLGTRETIGPKGRGRIDTWLDVGTLPVRVRAQLEPVNIYPSEERSSKNF